MATPAFQFARVLKCGGGQRAWYLESFELREPDAEARAMTYVTHRDIVMTSLFTTWLRLHCIEVVRLLDKLERPQATRAYALCKHYPT